MADSKLRRWWPVALIALAILILLAGPPAWREFLALLSEAERLKAALLSLGPLAPLAYIVLYALQIVAAPIPGSPFALASGYVFGPIAGGAYSLIAAAIGLTIALALSRRLGRPFVERLAGASALARWEQALGTDSAVVWFVIFLMPIGDAGYYLAGLSRARLQRVVVAGVLARAPNQFLMSYVGAQTGESLILWLVGLTLLSAMILLVWRRWGVQIQARVLAFGQRFSAGEVGK
jgi:uncharacterized membrane protein YdjX (TVP38/TMEM64 family)